MKPEKKIHGYSGSQPVSGVGGAITYNGVTQNGVDYTNVPQAKEDVYGGGAFTRQGTISSSDVESPYYTQPTKPVGSLSTENARYTVQSLEQDQQKDIERIANDQKKNVADKETNKKQFEINDKAQGGMTIEEITAINGSFDPNQYTIGDSGLYIPKQTTQPDPLEKENEEINKVFDTQLGLLDAASNAQMNAIRLEYDQLKQDQKAINERTKKSLQNYGSRTGMSRYTGESFQGILNGAASAGIKQLSKLASDEYKLIAQAESARLEGRYTLFAEKRKELTALRDKRQKTIDKIQEEIRKKREENQKQIKESSRNDAVAGLISQGITDPKDILNYLNYDDNGNKIGDFTAKEVAETLKSLSPAGDIEKLSGATRDFFILKGINQLPSNISSLPEDQQLFAYLQQQKKATSTGTAGNRFTLSEVRSQNLPVSLVGRLEDEIAQDFQNETPPPWFTEKLQNQLKQSLLPEVVSEAWQGFREDFLLNEKEAKKTTNYNKAMQYFSESYEGLTEEQLDSLATEVETRVNGGLSYADAIAEVINELE